MMKHLRLYPLIFGAMVALILICMAHIGWALYDMQTNRIPPSAQLVWEVTQHAAA